MLPGAATWTLEGSTEVVTGGTACDAAARRREERTGAVAPDQTPEFLYRIYN
jgi:hypothetical protein